MVLFAGASRACGAPSGRGPLKQIVTTTWREKRPHPSSTKRANGCSMNALPSTRASMMVISTAVINAGIGRPSLPSRWSSRLSGTIRRRSETRQISNLATHSTQTLAFFVAFPPTAFRAHAAARNPARPSRPDAARSGFHQHLTPANRLRRPTAPSASDGGWRWRSKG